MPAYQCGWLGSSQKTAVGFQKKINCVPLIILKGGEEELGFCLGLFLKKEWSVED